MHELIKRLIGQLDGQRSNLWHFQARPRRLWGAGGTGAHGSHSPRCCRSDTRLSAVAVCLPLIFSGGVSSISKSCGLFQGLTSNSELLSRSLTPAALGPASVSSATGIDIAWLVPGESWVMHGPPKWILFWGLWLHHLLWIRGQSELLNTTGPLALCSLVQGEEEKEEGTKENEIRRKKYRKNDK